MDVIESIKKDKAYIKCKRIVKTWEKEFKVTHLRTPSKFDIKEAPAKIKYAYKKYFQLKSDALDSSLSIYDHDEDLIGSPDYSQHIELIGSESFSPQSEPLLPPLPSGQEIEDLLTRPLNEEIKKNIKPVSPFTENLSKKLFQNRKFSLRNPRKLSLSRSQLSIEEKPKDTDEEGNRLSNELLDSSLGKYDNEAAEEKDFCHKQPAMSTHLGRDLTPIGVSPGFHSFNKNPPVRQINEAWIERATGIVSGKSQFNKEHNSTNEKFGLRNIVIPTKIESDIEKSCDYVENSESEEDDKLINKLKPALKKRKIDIQTNIQSKENNSEGSALKCNFVVTKAMESEEKSIENVDSKSENIRGRRKSKPVKINDSVKDHQPPDIAEYVPFGLGEKIVPRHTKVTNILKTVDNSANKVNETVGADGYEKLQKKIEGGTLNENFVRINIEKKVFVRGKKSMNFSKYKKKLNKDKKALHAGMEFPAGGKLTCFKCGLGGHMARYCTAHKGDTLLPVDNYEEDLPTLEDMQNVVSKETNNLPIEDQLSLTVFEPSAVPESFMKILEATQDKRDILPIYSDPHQETPAALIEALTKFGHKSFKSGQEEAIMRILCGMSTLLILSTGGGKSLCYQLPAYIYSQHYKCITLVISPLVSLMEDQVLSMPEFLKAGCLHNNQPPTHRKKIIQCLKDGEINILLISPEALISGDSSNGFAGLFKSLPKIAFACIDEAHCVSQWSHNFRPSYLMICRVLREKLNVKCILGLTATASQATIKSVIDHISIPDGLTGVITNPTLPDNLHLSVSFERDKDRALVSYLLSERIISFDSIIVYCIRRDECERVAAILRSSLQEPGKANMEKPNNKRKRMSYIAEAYHAGMSAAQRKKIQKHFMDGTVKIIVATVAFGMGINKPDIRCIIHYNMPSSFESYVQEVGRAGRDGQAAYCHVFMNNTNNDKNELLKHIYANTIDRSIVRKLLQKVFVPCECVPCEQENTPVARCKGHEVGIPIDSTVEELDLPSENIATLLCYVELHPQKYIKVLNNAYIMCKISSYGGPQKILEGAKNCPPLAMAYLVESKKDPQTVKKSVLEFNVIEVAAAIGWESGITKYHLKNLEWIKEGTTSKRSHLKVEFHDLGYRIKAQGDLSPTELDNILDDLHGIVMLQEKTQLSQLEESHMAFSKVGNYSLAKDDLTHDVLVEKSNELKEIIRNYFERLENVSDSVVLEERPLDVERIRSDARALIVSYKDCTFTGRSIAKIFQGISSPNFPAIIWGRCKFWRSHLNADFYGLVKIATEQIIQLKMS